MTVLIACEFSGTVRDLFAVKGHIAISADLLPTEKPGPHYQGDILEFLDNHAHKFDLMIAHPPCTYLTNSGVQFLQRDGRWSSMIKGAEFFKKLLHAPIPKIAIENPIMHKYARDIIGRDYDQVIQPWMFGHTETKATCLWLKNLPKLLSTYDVKKEMRQLLPQDRERLKYLPPTKDRWKIRSKTYFGIAEAMATQWGDVK